MRRLDDFDFSPAAFEQFDKQLSQELGDVYRELRRLSLLTGPQIEVLTNVTPSSFSRLENARSFSKLVTFIRLFYCYIHELGYEWQLDNLNDSIIRTLKYKQEMFIVVANADNRDNFLPQQQLLVKKKEDKK